MATGVHGDPSAALLEVLDRAGMAASGKLILTGQLGDVYALARANVDAPHRGSHQFRHALAAHMLRQDASLPEIGQVLRHRSAQTTSIYAKVDLEALRTLAVAWPGSAS